MSTTELLDVEPEPEPEIELEPEPERSVELEEIELEPEPPAALVPLPVMEVLPADFPLPILTRFVPDARLKLAAEEATAYALSIDVKEREGIEKADLALTALQTSLKAITEHFEDPCDVANKLHKRLTSLRAEWTEAGEIARKTVGRRVWAEQQRLAAIEAEARRKAQEEADRQAREAARRAAEAAEKAKAPAPIVEELKREAQTATAPPVYGLGLPVSSGLKRNSAVTKWRCRIAETPADAEPHPTMADLTPSQWAQVQRFLKAIIDGTVSRALISIVWGELDKRAASDKKTLAQTIPGMEAYEDGGVRAKGSRSK